MFRPAPGGDEERRALRRSRGWEGKFVVLNVSAMTDNKGIVFLLKSVAALAGKIPEPLVVLKGSDALYSSQKMLQDSARGLSRADAEFLTPRMFYTGSTLPSEQIVRYMRAADLYVSPYLAEGFNLPVLESAACGLPVICTRGGSTDDFVNDSWCLRIPSTLQGISPTASGRWLMPDLGQLVALIHRGATDSAWRDKARAAGPEWVRSKFTWKHSVDRLLAVIFPEGV
jgi:glycosyltransferase involved in cell wall biosynthesis